MVFTPSLVLTDSALGEVKVASPIITVTLLPLSNCATPPDILSHTDCFQACSFLKSSWISLGKSKPMVGPSCIMRWRKCAAVIMAFDGMQPTFKHTPPMNSRSTITVFFPSCAARIAATYPPGPAPITQTSNFSATFKSF